jgi:hypothetical protein
MPEPGGLTIDEGSALLTRIAETKPVAGAGLSGLAADPGNAEPLARLCGALGL